MVVNSERREPQQEIEIEEGRKRKIQKSEKSISNRNKGMHQ